MCESIEEGWYEDTCHRHVYTLSTIIVRRKGGKGGIELKVEL